MIINWNSNKFLWLIWCFSTGLFTYITTNKMYKLHSWTSLDLSQQFKSGLNATTRRSRWSPSLHYNTKFRFSLHNVVLKSVFRQTDRQRDRRKVQVIGGEGGEEEEYKRAAVLFQQILETQQSSVTLKFASWTTCSHGELILIIITRIIMVAVIIIILIIKIGNFSRFTQSESWRFNNINNY